MDAPPSAIKRKQSFKIVNKWLGIKSKGLRNFASEGERIGNQPPIIVPNKSNLVSPSSSLSGKQHFFYWIMPMNRGKIIPKKQSSGIDVDIDTEFTKELLPPKLIYLTVGEREEIVEVLPDMTPKEIESLFFTVAEVPLEAGLRISLRNSEDVEIPFHKNMPGNTIHNRYTLEICRCY